MYLIDTNVVSEARKGSRANRGVREFLDDARRQQLPVFLSAISVGELRRGVELVRNRGDARQAGSLETWLNRLVSDYSNNILSFDTDAAQVWGRLRAPRHEHALDKQIAATALIHDLTVVTRNTSDFRSTGVKLVNPFR